MSGVRCPGEQRKVAEARRPERRLGSSRGSPVRKSLRKSPPRRRTKARPSTHHPSTSSRRPGALYAPEGAAAARETHSAGDPARAPAGHGPARCTMHPWTSMCAKASPSQPLSSRSPGPLGSATQIRPPAAADLNSDSFGEKSTNITVEAAPLSREKREAWERGATSSRPRPWRCSGPSSCRPQPHPPMTKTTYAGRPSRCLHSTRPAFAAMGSRGQK